MHQNNKEQAGTIEPNLTPSPLKDAVRRAIRKPTAPSWRAGYVLAAMLGVATTPALAGPFPAEIELSSLQIANGGDGSIGFVLNGIDANDRSGCSVSAAGDINGDGIDDIIVGAFRANPGGRLVAGESYVVFGSSSGFAAEIELSSLLSTNGGDGSKGFVLNGIDANDVLGYSVSAAGDVNGDGVDDLIVGARNADPGGRTNAGQSYVLFGSNSGFGAEIELSSLQIANGGDGSSGFVLNGIDANDFSGRSVSAAGDVNGDGVADLIVGAHGADPGGRSYAGESYVIFGNASGFNAEFALSGLLIANGGDGSGGFVLKGIDGDDESGWSVSAAGDINGDGLGDLIVGTRSVDFGGRFYAGESYVIFGRSGLSPEIGLSSLLMTNGGDGSTGFVLYGIDDFDRSAYSVSAAGDVNGDGIGDLIVGAWRGDPGGRYDAGESYVVFGNTSGFGPEIELSTLAGGDGSTGFVLNGIDAGDHSGRSVSAAGDVNGDGIDDMIVGANRAEPGGRDRAGESCVVFGNTSGFNAEVELSTLLSVNGGDGSTGFVLSGIDPDDDSGFSVSAAGDVNGDGIGDLIVGAPNARPGERPLAGESYVVFGRADADADGVPNNTDNCTLIANPLQIDTDGDGFGNFCDADFTQNGLVDFADLSLMRQGFFGNDPNLDMTGNGIVGFEDLSLMRSGFFQPPGPAGSL